jgi:nucleoside-diphosphate-sugar epimerase
MSHLFCFGMGFSARTLALRLAAKGWTITGTSRSAEGQKAIEALGYRGAMFDAALRIPDDVTHIVVSAPPDQQGDPVLQLCSQQLRQATRIKWLAYLSTTGVYGDRGGEWVTEDSPLTPNTERGERRLAAEKAWLAMPLPVHLFRLAGIYGPGRNQLMSVLDGTAKRIIKQGQVFSRIHVEDIATVLEASIAKPHPGGAYNVCDDEPCPPQDVVAYAAELLGLPVPPDIPFEKAQLSPMARSFYADSKRVANQRIREELGVTLAYPNYREGLRALARQLKR